MFALPGTGLIGVATAKKIGCHASRNLQKRRFREAARLENLDKDNRFDILIVVNVSAMTATFETVRSEIARLAKETKDRWAAE